MKIETLKTSELVPYARNAKKHSDQQISQRAGSIREFGFNNPVLIDGQAPPGIIAGHGRVLAAQKLGLETVPCIALTHMTDTQKQAYVLADNRLAEVGGGWDMDLLRIELEELGAKDVDLDALGFGEGFTGAFDIEEGEMPDLASGDKEPFQQKTFTLHDEQAEEVDAAIAKAKQMGHGESGVNENSNGNAIAFICQFFNRHD